MAVALLIQMSAGLIAFAAEYTNHLYTPVGAKKNSLPENIFYTGDGRGFVLLDKAEGENGGYFCIAMDSYGKLQFDPDNTMKFDLEDENNIAYRINTALMGKGEVSGLSTLPVEIIAGIDEEHIWDCDKSKKFDNYQVACGVNLLSMGEYFKYIEKLGVEDNINNLGWWTRTPNIQWDTHILWLGYGTAKLGASVSWDAWGERAVRPCFWLSEDFFKNTKLPVLRMGSNIKKEILASAEDSALEALGYSN